MSKGIGKIQREILEAVQKDGVIALRDLAYSQPAISRAAYSLQARGLVGLWNTGINSDCLYYDYVSERKKKKTAFRRCLLAVAPGTTQEQLQQLAKRYRVG